MKHFRLWRLTAAALLLAATALGCWGGSVPEREQPGAQEQETRETETPSPADFFPVSLGSYWRYQGSGNEFASFTREVLHKQGNRTQIRENNGGTVIAAVYEVTENAVTRIYFEGEMYGDDSVMDRPPNDATVILQAPLKVGAKWTNDETTSEITGLEETVDTPAGTFTSCIEVTVSFKDSTVYEYYGKNIGLVKRVFRSGDYEVTSALEEYGIK